MRDVATIEITLREDGLIGMRSTFMGRQDAVYGGFPHDQLAGHVERLARELREQAAAELRRKADVHDAALISRG
nr:hypothetical protein [uncultured Acidovorax sp.]